MTPDQIAEARRYHDFALAALAVRLGVTMEEVRAVVTPTEPQPGAPAVQAGPGILPPAPDIAAGGDAADTPAPIPPETANECQANADDEASALGRVPPAPTADAESVSRLAAGRTADAGEAGAGDAASPAPHSNAADDLPVASAELPRPAGVSHADPPTKRQRVALVHKEHPDWSKQEIADHLGLSLSAVAGHLSLLRITGVPVRPSTPEPTAKTPTKAPAPPPPKPRARARRAAAKPRPQQPESRPAAFAPVGGDEPHIRRPKGKRFLVRTGNGEGQYLHQSLTVDSKTGDLLLVEGRTHAWCDSWERLQKVREKFPQTRAMFIVEEKS